MAAAASYVIKTCTFASQAIDGLQDVNFSVEGDEVLNTHDASITATAVFLDNIRGTVTVTSTNTALFTDADLEEGDTGALVIVLQKRAAGKGATAGQDKTITAAEAVLISKSGNGPHSDRGQVQYEFRVVDAEGVAPFAYT